jgi:hypothetical protein
VFALLSGVCVTIVPATKSRLDSHVHFDPTSDPDRHVYASDSGSLVVMFDTAP